jgi:polyphenol oxidase
MRALDTSDPNDPRGFRHQANVHCWSCAGEGPQVHFSWQFFAWHRAYLYFHERILGKLIGDMEFRLPYWDWETTSHRRIPGAYSTPGDSGNPLWNSTRDMSATDELADEDVGEDLMEAALTAGTFAEFGGDAGDNGIPEGTVHGNVHVEVGGDMGFFDTAARDPVFYAHHSNVDKMWSDWNKASSTHTNPTVAAFLNLSWNFYDENRVWRSITAAQVLNHETQLRYTYGPSRFFEILPCLLDWIVIRTDWQISRTLKLATAQRRVALALERGGRARLHFDDLPVPPDKSAVYRLYATPEAARRDEGPDSDAYLGTFAVVPSSRERGHVHKRTRNIILNISKRRFEALSRSQAPLRPAFVERGAKEGDRKVVTVAARNVFFTVADAEQMR